MLTSDTISLIALIVAVLGGAANFIYTRKQFLLATKPALWLELKIEKNYDKSKYHSIAHAEHGSYRVNNYNTSICKLKNLSTTLSITDISMQLQYSRPIFRIIRLGDKWHNLSFEMETGDNLDPLEEKTITSSSWDYVMETVFPEDLEKKIFEDTSDVRFAYYVAKKPIKFYLRVTIKYRAGISNSPQYKYIYKFEIHSQQVHSDQHLGTNWFITKKQ